MAIMSWPLLATLVVAALLPRSTLAEQCFVSYERSGSTSLLFGGVKDRCIANCAARGSDKWSQVCSFHNTNAHFSICSDAQRRTNFEIAKTLGGGDIFNVSPCDLVQYLRKRTLWLLGDSHSKTYYKALQCFLFDFWAKQECQVSTDQAANAELFKLPAKEGYNNCFHLLGPGGGRVCMVEVVLGTSLLRSTKVAAGGVLPLLRQKFAQPQDIFSIQFGAWHKKGAVNWPSYRPALKALGEYYQATKDAWPHMLFSETPASHYPGGARFSNCQASRGWVYEPLTGGLEPTGEARRAGEQMWMNAAAVSRVALEVLPKYDMTIVPIFNLSVTLSDNHIGNRHLTAGRPDCGHYCHAGIPEMWLYNLYNAMRNGAAAIHPLVPVVAAKAVAERPAPAALPPAAAPALAAPVLMDDPVVAPNPAGSNSGTLPLAAQQPAEQLPELQQQPAAAAPAAPSTEQQPAGAGGSAADPAASPAVMDTPQQPQQQPLGGLLGFLLRPFGFRARLSAAQATTAAASAAAGRAQQVAAAARAEDARQGRYECLPSALPFR